MSRGIDEFQNIDWVARFSAKAAVLPLLPSNFLG
jgi:hypothetical protein